MSNNNVPLSLPENLLEEVHKYNLDIQTIVEKTLREEILKRKKWLDQNKESLAYSNEYFLKNGLPISNQKQ